MESWISFLLKTKRRDEPAVLITVASTKGSVPREAGTKMIVTLSEVHGTIGGGHLEYKAIEIAKNMLASDGPPALHRFPLGATLGQCCGGVVNLLFEPVPADAMWVNTLLSQVESGRPCVIVTPVSGDVRAGKLIIDAGNAAYAVAGGTLGCEEANRQAQAIARTVVDASQSKVVKFLQTAAPNLEITCFFDVLRAPDFRILLFGAGHVGRALVNLLSALECTVTWIDSREDAFPIEVPSNVEMVCTDTPECEIDAAAPDSYFLVMTHSHRLDQTLSECILRRLDFAYFGLIGSASKRRQFERRLLRSGISNAQLARMVCPIGVSGIPGKEPATIAIAVAAQILVTRNEFTSAVETPGSAHALSAS